jgi:hypothetical protein
VAVEIVERRLTLAGESHAVTLAPPHRTEEGEPGMLLGHMVPSRALLHDFVAELADDSGGCLNRCEGAVVKNGAES